MTARNEIQGSDLYYRIKGKAPQHVRVWNRELAIGSLISRAQAEDPTAVVEIIEKSEYLASKGKQ